jgi:hypothetical protein
VSGASHGTAGDRGFDTSPEAPDCRLQFERAIRDDRRLEHPQKALAWALKSRADADGRVRVKVDTLAGDAGLSRRSLFEQLEIIIHEGWVQRKRTGRASWYALSLRCCSARGLPTAHQKCATRTSDGEKAHLRSALERTSTEVGTGGVTEAVTEGGPLARAPGASRSASSVRENYSEEVSRLVAASLAATEASATSSGERSPTPASYREGA